MTAQAYASPTGDCDLVLKGGVTSGVVYPQAILALARRYRFCSIGGTSVGAIAAAFAAAAEYARRRGDPGGFERLDARCAELPAILPELFQAPRQLRPLMSLARWAQGRPRLMAAKAANGRNVTMFMARSFGLPIRPGTAPCSRPCSRFEPVA